MTFLAARGGAATDPGFWQSIDLGPIGWAVGGVEEAAGVADGLTITFGRDANQIYHTFRWVDQGGYDVQSVQGTIEGDIRLNPPIQPGTFYRGVTDNGTDFIYSAHTFPDGTSVNVSSIRPQ